MIVGYNHQNLYLNTLKPNTKFLLPNLLLSFGFVFLFLITINKSYAQTCNGLCFDGSNDYVSIPHGSQYDLGDGEFTMEAWVQSNKVNQRIPCILSNRSSSSNTGFHFNIMQYTSSGGEVYDGNVFFRVANENLGLIWNSVNSIQDGSFHHVAITRVNQSNKSVISFYNDGFLIDQDQFDRNASITENADLNIGIDHLNSITPFDGCMRDVKFWNRALSAQEINENYKMEPNVLDPSLIGYWKLDDENGEQVVRDYSIYSNHGIRGINNSTETTDPFSDSVSSQFCIAPIISTKDSACENESLVINASNDISYHWSSYLNFSDTLSLNNSLEVNYIGEATYYVKGSRGVIDSVTVYPYSYEFCDKELVVYTFFSPNNDGVNEVFEIKNLEKYTSNSLWVYNRLGQEIYSKRNYQNDWNAINVEDGVYYYVLKVEEQNFEGELVVKR